MNEFDKYQSPFTWRYGSEEMRQIWSERNKRLLWRKIWLALAEAQADFGIVQPEQVEDIRGQVDRVNVARALEIEAEIHHDLMAELQTFAEACLIGGGVLHSGATSMDIEDNADALRIRESLNLVLDRLQALLLEFCRRIEASADVPVIGYTHLQPAEPTTLGYRLAQYAQDLATDWRDLDLVTYRLRGKGMKGAVGTAASFGVLVGVDQIADLEKKVMERLALPYFEVTTQTYPRKQEYQILCALAGLGGSLYKFAFDLRLLQSPAFGELGEPFERSQVGSSAMPFKRNPIKAEKINSLARSLAQMPRVAWDNAAHSLLERTLDDSANRRSLLPEAFLICDELLRVSLQVVERLQFDPQSAAMNLAIYGPFAGQEPLLMALVKSGADRQEMHARLREHAMIAWQVIRNGNPNPLAELLAGDEEIRKFLSAEEVEELLKIETYLGDAPVRARSLSMKIQAGLQRKKAKNAGTGI